MDQGRIQREYKVEYYVKVINFKLRKNRSIKYIFINYEIVRKLFKLKASGFIAV
jgi:hypothetical protein